MRLCGFLWFVGWFIFMWLLGKSQMLIMRTLYGKVWFILMGLWVLSVKVVVAM